ncbi:MAG: nuclear transport factor 2 family protein [Desulfovibrio sp.]|nr:nuclear transport factor 2 family protein [Desulfovibrio sp.]
MLQSAILRFARTLPRRAAGLALAAFLLAGLGLQDLAAPLPAQARADAGALMTEALLDSDAKALEKLLAPNFVFIASSGHIADREHFLESVRTKHFKVMGMSLMNMRESRTGPVRIITGNGTFTAAYDTPLPGGLMRLTLVTESVKGSEQVLLLQLTPVIPTHDCRDGNCRIR